MKKIILISILIVVLSSLLNSQSAWLPLNSGTNKNLNAITGYRYLDQTQGTITRHFIVGDSGTILYSSDNGDSWLSIPTGISENLNGISVAMFDTLFVVGNHGTILKIKKVGSEFISQILNTANQDTSKQNLNDVMMIYNSSTGYAVGDSGLILRTSNRGNSWIPFQTTRLSYNLRDIFSREMLINWVAGDSGTILLATLPPKVWVPKSPPQEFLKRNFKASVFIRDTGWVVGENGAIAFTKTGGNIFAKQFPPRKFENTDFNDVFLGGTPGLNPDYDIFKPKEGFIIGDNGAILKTTDYGLHWLSMESGTTKDLNKIFMLDSLQGIIVGDSGLILRTMVGGDNRPRFSVLPERLNFDAVTVNSINKKGFLISNSGIKEIIISSIICSNPKFHITQSGVTVPMEESRGVEISYSPNSEGNDNGYVTITGNFIGSPYNIPVQGECFDTIATSWESQNIFSVLTTVKKITYSNSTMYGVGESGSLIKSTDKGASWELMRYIGGTTSLLNAIKFVNATTGFAVGANGTILKTVDGGINWVEKLGVVSCNIIDINFTDNNTGIIIAVDETNPKSGMIGRTTDGGEMWTTVYNVTDFQMLQIHVLDYNTINIQGNGIIRSNDGGVTWKKYYNYFVAPWKVIYFDSSNGIGISGTRILHTSNGGIDWSENFINGSYIFTEVMKTGNNSAIFYEKKGNVLTTNDRGTTFQWTAIPYEIITICQIENSTSVAIAKGIADKEYYLLSCSNGIPDKTIPLTAPLNTLLSVSFSGTDHGVAAGLNATLINTHDGGKSWTRHLSGSMFDYMKLPFLSAQSLNDNTIIAVGYPASIVRSSDGGVNWNLRQSGAQSMLNAVYFLDSLIGYCAGEEGIILHTIDGGFSWMRQQLPTSKPIYSIKFRDYLNGIAVGAWGTILKTINGGLDWTPCESGTSVALLSIDNFENNWIIVGNNGTILKSTDDGNSWNPKQIATKTPLNSVAMESNQKALIVGNDGIIFYSTNCGESWRKELSGTAFNLYSISMVDSNVGTIVGDYGTILKTTNGGYMSNKNIIVQQYPEKFALDQNFPNPFNPETEIKFMIADESNVKLQVFDLMGREIETLVDEKLNPGGYHVKWNASKYASGVYFYRLWAGKFIDVKKMVLLR
ncbi:MAG: T9SS type A sorting domain-containing protein [Ignavibacteriales bacterium]|nr:T9SS type A sorting domain-containing protein [Ignavibacteriales bacterium]